MAAPRVMSSALTMRKLPKGVAPTVAFIAMLPMPAVKVRLPPPSTVLENVMD